MDMVERSSSNELSSAPNSEIEGPTSHSKTIGVSRDAASNAHHPTVVGGKTNGSVVPAQTTGDRQDSVPKQRKPRKKKDSDAAAAATPTEKKEKGVRRPRGASTATGSSRKKVKTEAATLNATSDHVFAPVTREEPFAQPRPQEHNVLAYSTGRPYNHNPQGEYKNEPLATSMQAPAAVLQAYKAPPTPPPPAPQPTVARSMAYDPVRSLTMPRKSEPQSSSTVSGQNITTPPRPTYNPSTSPAISSIIHPPEPSNTESNRASHIYQPHLDVTLQVDNRVAKTVEEPTVMEVDQPSAKVETVKKATPEVAPAKPATKPRAKEQPPPLPMGSGLLSSSLFGGDSGMDAKDSTDKGTSIVLHVDLKNPNNKIINFARLAEEKYGFAALYPRQAAQKERLAKVAAAGAALERAAAGIKGTPAGESGDEDVSVDIDRDSDNDGDVAMSGMNGTGEAVNSGTDGPAPTKRRKRKDEYDADDPFVDDSELLWEAQAAASKDGFFVYFGPLVPEGEKPTVERADGTVKRGRGRGRGGGPGSRGGRGAAAAAARDTEGGSGRGGGPGSRGGGVTRKPRITKAERQQRELEKKQREQMAVLAAKPPNYQP